MAITVKPPEEIALMRKAGAIVAESLAALVQAVRPGMHTIDLDPIAEREIRRRGGIPSFKGYLSYPAHVCVSVNEEIVHGIPGSREIRDGDLVSIDLGAIYDGWHGDAAVTIGVGHISDEARRLIEVCRSATEAGIGQVRAGVRLGTIGAAIQEYVESHGFAVVREYVGHGIGRAMHEDPQVPNYGVAGRGLKLEAGMCIAIEPMTNAGDWRTSIGPDGWTISTADGRWSAHFEHTMAVTASNADVLTVIPGTTGLWGHLLGLPSGVRSE